MFSMWSFALARLAGVLALALIAGLSFGRTSLWLVGLVCAYAAWQLIELYRLHRWLTVRPKTGAPDLGGVWGDVIAQIERLNRRKRFHKQRVLQLLRELRRSTAALPDGVIILTQHREIVWFNPPAGRLLGLKRGVDIGLRIDNLIRTPEFVKYLHSDKFPGAITIRPPLQLESYLSVQAVPYGAGQILLLVRDITRQMQIEAMRKDFVANASHELRTPLTVISGYLDTLAEDPGLDPAWEGPIRDMRSQARRMNSIIADLLELSRLESADGEAVREHVDVVGMLERLQRDAVARTERPAEVRLDLESTDGLFGSQQDIESAFTNLLVNALKYTPATGSVQMRWWSDVEGAWFAVTDTGIGIPEEHLPRITERFYRVDAGRSREQGGSGLGLAIVKHALQLHGASLEIRSIEGKGSTFTCHFPPGRIWHRDPDTLEDGLPGDFRVTKTA
jgi:two-component system phosphate regulon sensor histidine kinase PhoR